MSDYFKYKQGNPSSTTNEDYMWVYSKKLVLDVRKTIATDANSLKTWITTNKPIFYFLPITPSNRKSYLVLPNLITIFPVHYILRCLGLH